MISIKTLILQVALFAALALAQMPAVTKVDFQPEAPILPSTFTAAFTEHIAIEDGPNYVVEGYYYYSDLVEAIQVDYTVAGVLGSELIAGGEMTMFQVIGGEQNCFSVPFNMPFWSPDVLQNADFLGVSVSDHGRVLYAWGLDIVGHSLVVFTDVNTGALVYEYGDSFSLHFDTFDEGVPDSVFLATCSDEAAPKLPQDIRRPLSFLTSAAL